MQLIHDVLESPLDQVCVALDLETTGLDPSREEIIEIGAVKFKGSAVLDTFQTLVNPRRLLPQFIKQLTGISQADVDAAPVFSTVVGQLAAFAGAAPIVGHSIGFDLGFLSKAGLALPNPRYDTQELASVFLPNAKGYSLTALAEALGIPIDRPHRALEDARMSYKLYLALVETAMKADPGLLGPMRAVAERSSWAMSGLIRQIEAEVVKKHWATPSSLGVMGLDILDLRERLSRPRALHASRDLHTTDASEIESLLGEGGALAGAFPNYEFRPQQAEMAQAVASAFNDGKHLLAEAGTGVGKSVAYLLPAILFAVRNGQRVVISTNTINLQEQLINKDIPYLVAALEKEAAFGQLLSEFRFTHLKGRANYLCLRRWAQMAQSSNLSADDARMACKALVWLQDTSTGDRAEMNIPGRDGSLWDKISASDARDCGGREGLCFLRTARGRAEASHIVVVNHALLLTDLASGGGVIPEYDYLVIDEAHHLEDEASKQFGYEVSWRTVEDMAGMLGQQLQSVRSVVRNALSVEPRRQQIEDAVAEEEGALRRLREQWGQLASIVADFVQQHRGNGDGNQLRLTRAVRSQPAWSDVEVQWESFNEIVKEAQRLASRLMVAVEPLDLEALKDAALELSNWQEKSERVRDNVEAFVVRPDEGYVYWVTLVGQQDMPVLSVAPLDVAPTLNELLYNQKRSVVLTSATLSVDGSTEYLRERVGLPDADEVILGSPFDYEKSALLLVCPEVPDPRDPLYSQMLEDAVIRVSRASGGGVLALFTSHAALRGMRRAIKPLLESEGIAVLAQGVDGTPRQLMEFALANDNSVLLGTASLWEGVDLPGSNLRVVVLARLPFNVPTEPVFAARSERFENPFGEFTVPQAVLRFRQGFGRLIRSRDDRGVVVVLDSRIQSRGYGAIFLRSLPKCTVRQSGLRGLGPEVGAWLAR